MSNSIKIGKKKAPKFRSGNFSGLTQSFESRDDLRAAMYGSRHQPIIAGSGNSDRAAGLIKDAMGRVRDKHGTHQGENQPDKGHKGGSCNRTACQAPNAVWFNHSTRAYYCTPCARMLNREAERFRSTDTYLQGLGHELCTLDESAATDRR